MALTATKKEFLTEQVPELLKTLHPDTQPAFGLMTPQHMIEHLALTTKTSIKRYGEQVDPPTQGQLGFKKFIERGAILQHRPSGKSTKDLPELKYKTLEEAVAQIPVAVSRFYDHFESNPGYVSYLPFSGEINFTELELFHYQHYRYHLWQFGLQDSYP